MNDFERFPHIAKRYLIDLLFDSVAGACSPLASPRKGSSASQINNILSDIHRKQGGLSYLNNRVREQISVIFLQAYIPDTHLTLSTIVNDILHHTDAILCIGQDAIAVDLTEKHTKIHQKLNNGEDGTILVEDPKGNLVSLPFSVIYMPPGLVDRTGDEVEGYLKDNAGVSNEDLSKYVSSLIPRIITPEGSNGTITQDGLPSAYMRDSSLSDRLQLYFSRGYQQVCQSLASRG